MTDPGGQQPQSGKGEIVPRICRPSRDTRLELVKGLSEQVQDGEEKEVAADQPDQPAEDDEVKWLGKFIRIIGSSCPGFG